MQIIPLQFESLGSDNPPQGVRKAAPEKTPEAPPPPPRFSLEEMEAAKRSAEEEGYARGMQAGLLQAKNERAALDASLLAASGQMLSACRQAVHDYGHFIAQQSHALTRLALVAAKKVAGKALKDRPLDDIEVMVKECLAMLHGKPKVTIYVHPSLVRALEGRLQEYAAGRGEELSGDVTVQESADLALTDCRVEWSDGAAERNVDALWAEVDAVIHRARPISADRAVEVATEERSEEVTKEIQENNAMISRLITVK